MERFYRPIAALADFDFDGLYAASLDYLNGVNNRWPKGFDADRRKTHFKERLEANIANPQWLGFVLCDKGRDLALTAGLLDNGNYHLTAGLTAPDDTGSRAYAYAPEQKAIWLDCLRSQGVRRVILTMPLGSSLASFFTVRHGVSAPKVVDGRWRQEFDLSEDMA